MIILTTHRFGKDGDFLSISTNTLEKAILTIKNLGFYFISYGEFKSIILNKKIPKNNAVLLTIDDGYAEIYDKTYTILKKYQIPAVVFLITSQIYEDNEFLNLDQINKMHQSGLIEFDSHTHTHFSLDSNDAKNIKIELETSLNIIKQVFQDKAEFGLCYPKGEFNENSLNLVKQSKYKFGFTTIEGGFYGDGDLYQIKRIDISSNKRNLKNYVFRLKKKLFLYKYQTIGNFYSKLKKFRLKFEL